MSFELKIPQLFSTSIDYEGQRKAEKIFQIVVSIFAVIGFVWGFYMQQFSQTLLVLGFGLGVCALLILPPWPFWNKNPIKWQKVQPKTETPAQKPAQTEQKDTTNSKKKK